MFKSRSRHSIVLCTMLCIFLLLETGCPLRSKRKSHPQFSEITVLGKGVEIPDNSTAPTTADDTDWGNVESDNPADHIFTITNSGRTVLNITLPVTLTGSGDFTVTTSPAATVNPSGSTTFVVRFSPTSNGLKTATVNIANDDSNENPYNFDIQGTGVLATTRVSVASDGTQTNSESTNPSICADGSHIAFTSSATNLVAGDTNATEDVFVHDRQTAQTTRVSVATGGTQGNNTSDEPSISADGRYVAFYSVADNLVTGDTNAREDVFVHDRQTAQTTRVSVDSAGVQGNGDSNFPSISADGRYVAFESGATNLVGGDTNGRKDIFVHDRQTPQKTTRVSVDSAGVQGNRNSSRPSISGDGRYVAFYSAAFNLVIGDTNTSDDVFVHDRQTPQTTRVSVDSAGVQGDSDSRRPSISGDGRYVAFPSDATNLVAGDSNGFRDVFVHDRQTAQTTRVSVATGGTQGNDYSITPFISANGRYVAFESGPLSNLVAGDTNGMSDIFLRDQQTGATTLVSINSTETQSDNHSANPSISADGRYVVFGSPATNLDTGDTNGARDIFVRDRGTSEVILRVEDAGDHIAVLWEEPDTGCAGFHLWRRADKSESWQRIDGSVIAAASVKGATHIYRDFQVEPGISYHYRIETIDGTGSGRSTAPISCRLNHR